MRGLENNILNASANDIMALAVSFSAYIGNSYEALDLAILSGFFNVIGDALSLYSAVSAKQNGNSKNA